MSSVNWQFRQNTQDEDIYREVYVENCYQLPDDMSGITVIDVGANIGCFTIACLERGADYVIAYEPDFANQMQLREHLLQSKYKNVQDIGRFVVGDSWKSNLAYREAKDYQKHDNIDLTGAVNLFECKADPLDTSHLVIGADSIKSILNSVKGDRIWIKLDCEGAEYQILSCDLPWGRIERIFGECHDYRDGKFSRYTNPVEVPPDAFGGLEPNATALFRRLRAVGYNDIRLEYNREDPHLTLFFASRDEISDAMNDQNLRNRLQEDMKRELEVIERSPFAELVSNTREICSICGKPALCVSGNVNALVCSECFDTTNGLRSVVVLTPFRNARRYLPLYFEQISSLKGALEKENMKLRLVAAEGDSLDNTRERIIELASEHNIPLEVVDTTHGHMRWGSVEDPVRMKVMSDVMNKALEKVSDSDDIVVWIMSDLKWDSEDIMGLIKDLNRTDYYSVVAPLVFTDCKSTDQKIFYDTWAYRRRGKRFNPQFPYHDDFHELANDNTCDVVEIDSAGTCLVMHGWVARKYRASNMEAVSFCDNVRKRGYSIGLSTSWQVYHAPQSSARILWIGDTVCVSGFSRVSHNILPILSEAGYEVDVIATNYGGFPHNYPYLIWPAGEDSGAYLSQQLVYYADKQGKQYDAVIVLDDPWNVPRITRALEDLREKVENLPPVIAWVMVDGKNIKPEDLNNTYTVTSIEFGKKQVECVEGYGGEIDVVPFGVNTEIYRPLDKLESRKIAYGSNSEIPEDAYIVGTVSTNQLRKRLDLVLKYFAEWVEGIDNAYLYLCLGASNNTGCDVISLIRYYGLRKKVIINTSLLSEPTMAHVYNSFDVFISLSQGEGFGLCALEAMACGVPCILSDWSGYSSWVPNDCAIKVPCTSTALSSPLNSQAYVIGGVADPQGTINALQRLYMFPNMREILREKGLSLAKQFSWKSSGEKLLNVIEQVVERKHEKVSLEEKSA